MFPRSILTRALTMLGLCAIAAAQSYVTIQPDPANGDGTLWFQSLGGSSSGGTQLASYDMHGGGLDGIYALYLVWTSSKLIVVETKDLTVQGSAEVLVGGQPVAPCLGAASFSGGFIVTYDAFGVPVAIRPHAGALFWSSSPAIGGPALFALEVSNHPGIAGAINVVNKLGGTFKGVAVLSSEIDDIDPTAGGLNSHVVASSLAYTNGNLFRVECDLFDGGIAGGSAALQNGGAAITNVLGVTVLNSGFDLSLSPDAPEGAAAVWNTSDVLLVEHRTSGDLITPILDGGAAIANCWGVMPLYVKSQSGPLPPTTAQLDHAYWVATTDHVYLGKGASTLEFQLNDQALPTYVKVGNNPLLKRQATNLYEVLGQSTLAGEMSRGFVIGFNQRSP